MNFLAQVVNNFPVRIKQVTATTDSLGVFSCDAISRESYYVYVNIIRYDIG